MPFVTRATRTVPQTTLNAAKPFSRKCPDCGAEIGTRCWSLQSKTLPKRIAKVHPGRRTARKI